MRWTVTGSWQLLSKSNLLSLSFFFCLAERWVKSGEEKVRGGTWASQAQEGEAKRWTDAHEMRRRRCWNGFRSVLGLAPFPPWSVDCRSERGGATKRSPPHHPCRLRRLRRPLWLLVGGCDPVSSSAGSARSAMAPPPGRRAEWRRRRCRNPPMSPGPRLRRAGHRSTPKMLASHCDLQISSLAVTSQRWQIWQQHQENGNGVSQKKQFGQNYTEMQFNNCGCGQICWAWIYKVQDECWCFYH